jgi:hypothetical protein
VLSALHILGTPLRVCCCHTLPEGDHLDSLAKHRNRSNTHRQSVILSRDENGVYWSPSREFGLVIVAQPLPASVTQWLNENKVQSIL